MHPFLQIVLAAVHHGRRDPIRLFTREQKQILLHRAGYRCEHHSILGGRCPARTHLEADHVIPWSRSGRTRIDNGQILCRRHNRRKGRVMPSVLTLWLLSHHRKHYS